MALIPTYDPEGRKADKNRKKQKKNYAVEIFAATGSTLDLMISTLRVG